MAFCTAFSDQYDLVQVMHGLSSLPGRNCPVDFRLAGLKRKDCSDIWHVDQVLAFCTDECSPMIINGEDIGGNHGHPCALRVKAPGHGKDVRDVGSLWQDERGLRFTLLRAESSDSLLFLSENMGPSDTAYDFADHAQGRLRYVENGCHPGDILPAEQQGGVQLTPAIRHLQREAVCFKDGAWQEIGGWTEGCERAEIREVYEIVNPATVARAIRDGRPAGGYRVQPSLAAGEAMFLHRMTYRIENDGTILCDFNHEVLQDVHMPCYLGIMHQARSDVYGGGIWRYIPKVKAFAAKGYTLDFSRPLRTAADTLPNNVPLTRDIWQNPASPPDRQIDFIRRADGTDAVAFASGFLPIHDGAPERRASAITDAGMLVKSCKTYPTFAGGASEIRQPHRESAADAMHFPRLRGIAYKKFFIPQQGACVHAVPDGADTYVYMDFYADEAHAVSCPVLQGCRVTPLESTADWQLREGNITATGAAGYAVFRVSGPQQKG